MLTLPEGDLALARAAASLPSTAYERAIIAVRGEHEAKYQASALLRGVFGESVEVLVLDRDTRGPAETVAEMIRRAGVTGAFVVKDADSFFDSAPPPDGNFVALSDVRQSPHMANVGAKSFAIINENNLVVEMVEKSLASNFVSVGLYGFADAATYLDLFDHLAIDAGGQEFFVSHVMNRGIIAGMVVAPHFVAGLVDVGTLEDWRRYVRPRGTIITDLDGVVFQNHSRHFPPFWTETDKPIDDNVATLLHWQNLGAQLIFMTARPEEFRAKTEQTLAKLGLRTHALIMGCHHGRRFLVNDHAASNPYPAAVAVSTERNSPSLSTYLKDWL